MYAVILSMADAYTYTVVPLDCNHRCIPSVSTGKHGRDVCSALQAVEPLPWLIAGEHSTAVLLVAQDSRSQCSVSLVGPLSVLSCADGVGS